MNNQQFNDLAKDYIQIGSWLNSLENTSDDAALAFSYALKKSAQALLDKVNAYQDELRTNHAKENPLT